MKKYTKPLMLIEHYRPSTNMAACGWDMNSQDPTSCTAYNDPNLENEPDESFTLFTDRPRCLVLADVDFAVCYFTGSDDHARIFTS